MKRQKLFGKRSRFPGSSNRRQNNSLARGGRQLRLEPLEDRHLLSAGGTEQLTFLGGNESDVAVDPNNPLIVATAQFETVLISRDGGRTFPTTVNLNAPAPYVDTRGGDPTLSFDSQGNLYFGYLSNNGAPVNPNFTIGVFGAVINPQTGAVLQNTQIAAETNTFDHDKEWVAADHWADSPFRDNAYMLWSRLGGGSQILFSRTTNGGANWSAPVQLDPGGQGFVWPSEVSVARNGDVWVGWHTNTANNAGNLGGIVLRESSDGGATFQPLVTPFPAGTADITDNAPPNPRMPGNISWMQGAVQPRILLDPIRPNNIYVIAVDDPDNNYAAGDPANIVMARSTDYGASWSRTTISHGPFGTIQTMPSAAIDEDGNISVVWYDSRNGQPSVGVDQIPGNADDNLLLDVFATVSLDGGLTWSNDFQINEVPFDPDLGAGDRFPPNNVLRIGEYNGHDADSGYAFVSWTANNGANQDIAVDVFSALSAFPDQFEENDTVETATVLGSAAVIQENSLTIHPGDSADDEDFFLYTAHDTGKLLVNIDFFHEAGDLNLEIQDTLGNQIALANSNTDDETLVIPVVLGEDYAIHVLGVNGNTNVYDLEIENFAAPIPDVVLDPADDTGMSNSDEVTFEDEARIFIEADLAEFAAEGIDILTPTEVTNQEPGAAVEVFVNGGSVGYATPIAGNTLFQYTFTAGELSTAFIPVGGGGGLNFVKGAVRMFDGQQDAGGNPAPADGRTQLSEPLLVTYDPTAPAAPSVPDLLPSSDSGASDSDNVTNVNPPAFMGTAEVNTKIDIFADSGAGPVLVGEGVVGSDRTDGVLGNGLGRWEVTIEPLADGTYDITAEVEDLAGNISAPSEALVGLVIDTIDGSGQPERPTVDLLDADDTGMSATDNNTRLDVLRFRVTADPGTTVDVKDGNTVIDTFVMPVAGEAVRTYNFVTLVGTTGFPAEGPHPLSAESTDLAGNRGPQAEELLVTIDQTAPTVDVPDMLASSDSGLFSNDEVTNINAPAFDGFVRLQAPEAGVKVFLFAGGRQIGQTDLLVDFQDNTFQYEITSEPLDDGAYGVAATVQDLAGNFSGSLSLPIWIDTVAPNTPYLDLVDASDSGRSNQDNVTNVNQPTVTVTADDTVSGDGNPFWHDVQYRIYDRPDLVGNNGEVLLVDSLVTNPGLSTNGFFTETLSTLADGVTAYTLPDAVHNLKLEVEDRAGNISHDFLLPVTIDTVAPPVSIVGIDPATSDTGVEGQPATFADNITSDTTTGFVGTAEADAIVRMWADGAPVSAGVINGSDVFQGLTVAVPLDGNLAFPNGQWNLAGQFDLNDPTVGFPLDGHREISTTAEDLAGNVSDPEFFDIFIDTRGPQVNGVAIAGDPAYDLFNPKGPATPDEGPTPLVFALDIAFVDQPTRLDGALNFVYPAVNQILATEPGNYLLVGDANGVIPIERIAFNDTTVDGGIGTTTVTLNFFKPLPDDRFTLTIFDRIKDDAGNALDGESNAIEPQDNPQFPSGDGDPGESFVGRFTVDSRPEIGVWSAGSVYTDTNGNFLFDPTNLDFTNRDITYLMGFASDDIFAGNFALLPGDTADGFDKLAAYGHNTASRYRWLVDTDNDGVANVNSVEPAAFDGLGTPVAGNFDDVAGNGDEVGLFTGSSWLLDTDHDFLVSDEVAIDPGLRGYPIVGDFDGDGADDLGVFLSGVFSFDLAAVGGLGNGIDATFAFNFLDFIGPRERPVAADMNQDGIDDLGLWVPDRSGAIPEAGGEWYFLVSDATLQAAGSVAPLNHTFSPVPFGDDLFAQFGDQYAAPIVGNFDPPVAGSTVPAPDTLTLEGTDGDDTVEVTVDGPGQWTVELNGIQLEVGPEIVAVEFDGLGGKDSVILTGSAGTETVKLWPGRGTLTGEGYSVAIAGAESIVVRGGGGADVAVLYANPDGKDSFRAYPEVARLFGDGYFNQVASFRYVSAVSTDGNEDTAALYDDPNGDDVLKAGPDQARLYSDRFSNKAVNFRYVTAIGTEGNKDTAVLFDDPAGDDVLKAGPEEAKLYGDGFLNRVRSFRYVKAIGTQGNKDVAVLFDDPNGDDVLKAWPNQAKLYSDSFHNMAVDFLYVNAYGTPGNNDVATFIDSAGKDTFEAWPEKAKLSGEGFFNQALSFSRVHAYSVAGGDDVAYLHGSAGNDRLVAKSHFSRLSGDGFANRAVSFDQVYAYGSDGADLAILYDAVLEAGLTQQPVPAGISSIVWLYDIETIRERSEAGGGTSTTDAVDTILTAYWQ